MSVLDGCVGWVGRSTVQLQVLMLQCINATEVEQPITLESSDNQITIATIGVVGRGCMALADELNSINFQRCKQAAAGAPAGHATEQSQRLCVPPHPTGHRSAASIACRS
jgi:hypothetical protein